MHVCRLRHCSHACMHARHRHTCMACLHTAWLRVGLCCNLCSVMCLLSASHADRMQRYILEGRFQDYHGEGVNPKYLSVWEKYVLGWHKVRCTHYWRRMKLWLCCCWCGRHRLETTEVTTRRSACL